MYNITAVLELQKGAEKMTPAVSTQERSTFI